MPPRFMRPPIEFLGIELVYFLVVVSLCLIIFYMTRDIYKLTKHKGLFFFRNTFLFFAIAYGFRLFHIIIRVFREADIFLIPRGFHPFTLVFVGYFSTLAIGSLALTVISHKIKWKKEFDYVFLQIIAIFITLFIFIYQKAELLILFHLVILLVIVVSFFIKKPKSKKLWTYNKINYLLILVFWIINIFAFNRFLVPIHMRVVLYIISGAIFVSIFIRVKKRLGDAKKKR